MAERASGRRDPARHETPTIDQAALDAARAADRLLAAAREVETDRWIRFVAPLPDRLRDEPIQGLRAAARQARAAFGPKDSIRDVLPDEVTQPFLESIDRLIKAIARFDAHRD